MSFKTLLCNSAFALAASLTSVQAQATEYPLTIENCGFPQVFEAAPKNVVSVGQQGTEILYALDLGDRLSGTALWFTEILPEYKAQNDKVERIADNMPGFEAVIAKRPELAFTQYEWMIGAQGVVGTRPQFHDLGVKTYIMPTDCDGKDNLVGSDGTRTEAFSIESLYKTITELGQIFDRQQAALELVDQLKSREAAAVAKAAELKADQMTAAVWFSSAEMELDPYMAGRSGAAGDMIRAIGLTNVVTSDEEWPTVGWETIAKANPTWLILAEMDRRRFPADDVEKKLEFLKSDPVASQLEAVKSGRIIVINSQEMEASLRRVTGIEKIVTAIARAK
ncbi:ABC transporter substrate-binding protein [Falsigemmobacter intermedius]|uniref:ABC transporter substrate-binding protein n=1 Tax=Falsigemmobacter intermedius TaxID=1553448 RepID=A0A3S3U3F2_9RHOB|nr:ABC transporter substrate-binding protein [Falsigemmobacter intermedius]RWY38837.1 ABC transporter substrate-binding protein [Falsigemmobacter intermedius]